MRAWLYRALLAALWLCGMACVMLFLAEDAPRLFLLVGGWLAGFSTVALAEDVANRNTRLLKFNPPAIDKRPPINLIGVWPKSFRSR
jgi:hypothetical protein